MTDYLMEHENEGRRIKAKTRRAITIEHLNTAGLESGMQAVDIGCASGEVLREMARMIYPARVTGFDASAARIRESRELDEKLNFTNIDYVQGDVYDIGLASNTFDFVWSRFLFEYLKKPVSALEELKRITRPGGRVVVADLDGNCLFHYPMDEDFTTAINEVFSVVRRATGFDPFVGRKLYHYFYQVGFQKIRVDILPYHQIAGAASPDDYAHWSLKIRILKENFKSLAGERYEPLKHVFSRFLDFLKQPDTLTYSTIFVVQGVK